MRARTIVIYLSAYVTLIAIAHRIFGACVCVCVRQTGKYLPFLSHPSNVNRLPKKHGRSINLFALLRVKRAGYSIAGKYIHIGPSIPYLLNQIGGRGPKSNKFQARPSVRFAARVRRNFARRPTEGLSARRRNNLVVSDGQFTY